MPDSNANNREAVLGSPAVPERPGGSRASGIGVFSLTPLPVSVCVCESGYFGVQLRRRGGRARPFPFTAQNVLLFYAACFISINHFLWFVIQVKCLNWVLDGFFKIILLSYLAQYLICLNKPSVFNVHYSQPKLPMQVIYNNVLIPHHHMILFFLK